MELKNYNSDWNITENYFKTHDGISIFYRHWELNTVNEYSRVIVFLHRGYEHSGRVVHIVRELGFEGTPFFAWDARGNGKSDGERGYSPNFPTLVRDLDTFIHHISGRHQIPIENIIIIGQSMGAVIASTWVHDYAPKIKALILASPAFDINLWAPFALKRIKLRQSITGNFYIKSDVKGKLLSHDLKRASSYHNDPLVSFQISSNVLIGIFNTSKRVVSDSKAIITPVLLLISGNDKVVRRKAQEDFFKGLSSPIKEKHILEGFYHDILGEKERYKAYTFIRDFIFRVENAMPKINLFAADEEGFTFEDYKELSPPLSTVSFKSTYYAFTRFTLKAIGIRAAKGIKLGHETGFGSGCSLDYLYTNEPKGIGLLGALGIGKLIDKRYLDSISGKGIRIRKNNLEKLIGKYTKELYKIGTPVRILDIASGHGRYLLDAIKPYLNKVEIVLLRDFNEANVKAGSDFIKEKNLQGKIIFSLANTLDSENLKSIKPQPTLGIVCGLYVLFLENKLLKESLKGLSTALPKGGYLIYTNHPWNPQVGIIPSTLNYYKQKGKSWLTRRTQVEMDQLVESSGFKKVEQLIDEWGLFTVSVAKKI